MDVGDRVWEGCGDVEVGRPTQNHFVQCRTGFSQLYLKCTHLYHTEGAQAEGGSNLNIHVRMFKDDQREAVWFSYQMGV